LRGQVHKDRHGSHPMATEIPRISGEPAHPPQGYSPFLLLGLGWVHILALILPLVPSAQHFPLLVRSIISVLMRVIINPKADYRQ
jgi:hypothetical protein